LVAKKVGSCPPPFPLRQGFVSLLGVPVGSVGTAPGESQKQLGAFDAARKMWNDFGPNPLMRPRTRTLFYWVPFCIVAICGNAFGTSLDQVGATMLRQVEPALLGNGIRVALVEPPENGGNPPPFEVDPAAVGQIATLFSYTSNEGSSSVFPNSVGAASGHANGVGWNFFSANGGVSPQIAHIHNYEASHFVGVVLESNSNLQSRIVNQSFVFQNPPNASEIEATYDDFASQHKTLFVSGAGFNGSQVQPPSSSYNGICVGVSDVPNPPMGPTLDGRCKPDIIAPGGFASFATPFVSGSAAVLLQAAIRGDGGSSSQKATNLVVVKALLLNGAIKPAGWTNHPNAPLDHRFGAGTVNIFNSWHQLKGGLQSPIEMTLAPTNTLPAVGASNANIAIHRGWDFRGITNSSTQNRIHHYYFQVTNGHPRTLTATLTWNRKQGANGINNLDLRLVDANSSNLVSASESSVDNVEHLFIPQLAPGRYDLQVVKKQTPEQVSNNETYGLAFELFGTALQIGQTNANDLVLRWPAAPAGFVLYSSTNLNSPGAWSPVALPVVLDTNTVQDQVVVPSDGDQRYFRLQRP
jgi:hypothetical protein